MYQHLPSPVKFREDINGLRAWAVIAVLLFHFSLIGLPGGFAGVDVFFVISGYLMTSIIVGSYEKGNFSIWNFYMARARRILPALLVVIGVLLALGWFWLPTFDYKALGSQSTYGITFLSNIYYWRSSMGYFDSSAEEKWLLHTWSLAVEAQFYVIYPVFLALLWKFWQSVKAISVGVLILFVASLALNLVVTGWKPTAAFYLLPTRGWELAAGGMVYLVAKQGLASESLKTNCYWFGWIQVIASFIFITEELVWPGYWAILPVMGTSLIILGQRESCKLTDNGIAQWLGERSYSLYLWHWPLVVALYFLALQSDYLWVIGAFSFSIFLAHLSYKFVEIPTRQYLSKVTLFKEIFVIVSVAALLVFSAVSVMLLGFNDRDINQTEQAKYVSKYTIEYKETANTYLEECNFFDANTYTAKAEEIPKKCVSDKKNSVFIWGDSHAQALSFGVRNLINSEFPDVGFSQVASSGCRPHIGEDPITSGEFKKSCDRSNKYAYTAIQNLKPKLVIMAQREGHEDNNLIEIASNLIDLGVERVLIVGPEPQWNIDLPRLISRRYWHSKGQKIQDRNFKSYLINTDRYLFNKTRSINDPRIMFASPIEKLCELSTNCIAILDSNKTPIAFDYGHLTKEGSIYVTTQVIKPYLEKYLER